MHEDGKMAQIKPQIPVAVALIKNDQGQVLLARRNEPDLEGAHDKWELVGGKVEFDETPEQTAVREVKEETGLDVEIISMVPKIRINYWTRKGDGITYKVLLLPFMCKIVGGELHTGDFDHKISELKFVEPGELGNYDMLPLDKEIILGNINNF